MSKRGGPLAGIRIVEMDAIGPVPLAAMILADMGADVVRLVRPGSPSVPVLERNRATVEADLKSDEGRVLALDLIGRADAVIEGYRPGVMERLGLGPELVHARNPRLVFGRMTGWGQDGPLAARAGHDINYISLTGALHAMGREGQPPSPPLNLVGDYGGGAMFLVTGLLAAIIRARSSGQGDVIDVAMTEGTITLLSMFHAFLAAGHWRDRREANLLDGGAHFYRCYACADGRYVAVGCIEPQFYAECLSGLQLDPADFPQMDVKRWPEFARSWAARFAEHPRDHWAELFARTDACVTPVLNFAEAPAHPHNAARGSYVEAGGIVQASPAPRFASLEGTVEQAERLHGREALARWT